MWALSNIFKWTQMVALCLHLTFCNQVWKVNCSNIFPVFLACCGTRNLDFSTAPLKYKSFQALSCHGEPEKHRGMKVPSLQLLHDMERIKLTNHFKFGMFGQAKYHVCDHQEAQHRASVCEQSVQVGQLDCLKFSENWRQQLIHTDTLLTVFSVFSGVLFT